ncbi:MAG: aminotransferase class I/II-fold pyridoxal phosphate-dependent enzyme [Nanoarchaeota archaeon]|nr:aminotransferase class I/II-fold pyridoxal phosphate-dependent enzyme [Nanoarchaeota archaeon]
MELAQRMEKLGTETAFIVSAEAAALARKGHKIYPFHLGDMNIKTPENIIEAAKRAMDNGKTGYAPTPGILELRQAIAEDIGKARGLDLTLENVSVQPGGKPTIGKFIQIFMEPGEEVLYPNPGYPIYESMINYYGGVGVPYTFFETDTGFAIDFEGLKRSISPNTKCLIYNNYQNPMGAESSEAEMKELAELCIKHNLMVLSDEAYFDMIYEDKGTSITSLPGMFERSVILYTFSKKFAMTGWRLGAAIGPKEAVEQISRLNVNDESCSNHFIQHAAIEALTGSMDGPNKILEILKARRDVVCEMLNNIKGVHVHVPNCTFYLFINVTGAMKNMGIEDVEEFRKLLLHETGVSFTTRRHFGTPLPGETQKYIRFAYSGIDVDQIKEGLRKMKEFIEGYGKE